MDGMKSAMNSSISQSNPMSSHSRQDVPSPPPHAASPDSVDRLDAALRAGHAAAQRAIKLEQTTKLSPKVDLVYLDWDDVFVEDMLGVGGFASVYLVTCPKLRRKHARGVKTGHDCSSSLQSFDRSWAELSEMSIDESEDISDAYALKCLSNRTISRPRQFITGACDMVGEAFLLGRLSHPNIIQLYGVTSGSMTQAYTKKGGYFLVLEALETTLNDKLQQWRKAPVTSIGDFMNRTQNQSVPSVDRRLGIVEDIAKGMEYLHSQNVIFRDLKPENVGLDRNGLVKLFDFGLAREIQNDRLPGIAGSVLYLSPETILENFNCKASDVYSFGILTWEVVSLARPYQEFCRPDELKNAVANDRLRPDSGLIDHPVKSLIDSCWQRDYTTRPTFGEILRQLDGLRGNDKRRRKRVS